MEFKIFNKDSYPTDNQLMQIFGDWFDPCPLNDNPVKDGLSIDWPDKTYVNPPYSRPLPWVKKAVEEASKGKRIVMLLRADTSTKYFQALHEAGSMFFWVHKRLRHNTGSPANFASMLVIVGQFSKKGDNK